MADNELMVSKYAENLPHEDTGRKISSDPKTWMCEESGKTENLWLNLSTGENRSWAPRDDAMAQMQRGCAKS